MWRSSMQRWSKTREQGLRTWLVRRGVLRWGVPMYILMSAVQVAQRPSEWRRIVLGGLPIWLACGVLWGALTWAMMERLYRRRLRSERDH